MWRSIRTLHDELLLSLFRETESMLRRYGAADCQKSATQIRAGTIGLPYRHPTGKFDNPSPDLEQWYLSFRNCYHRITRLIGRPKSNADAGKDGRRCHRCGILGSLRVTCPTPDTGTDTVSTKRKLTSRATASATLWIKPKLHMHSILM
jgi:hypothetical protein